MGEHGNGACCEGGYRNRGACKNIASDSFGRTFCCSQAVCLFDPLRYRQLADLQQLIEFIECLLKAIQLSLAQFAGE